MNGFILCGFMWLMYLLEEWSKEKSGREAIALDKLWFVFAAFFIAHTLALLIGRVTP